MRWIMILSMMLLTGCLSTKGIFTTGTATTGAVLGTALAGPTVGVVVGAGAGLATDAVTPDATQPSDFSGTDGELNFWELLAFMWANFTQHIITIGILIGAFWILTTWLGIRMPRKEEKVATKILMEQMEKNK